MECGGCTLCCKMINVSWMDSPAGEYCKHCFPDMGCQIFDTVDQRCKEYACAYAQQEKASIKFRPDKCHVIFERVSPDMFTGLVDPDFPIITEDTKAQLMELQHQGFSIALFILGSGSPMIIPKTDKTYTEVLTEVVSLLGKQNECRSLHN